PNYRQLLPEQFEHELQLPREELLDVVRRVSLMAQRNSPLRLRFADGELTVSAQTPDVGEARESLPAPFNADAMEIGFNAEVLRDGLESVDSPTVRLKLISPLRPAVLQGETAAYTYLIMPIRLAGYRRHGCASEASRSGPTARTAPSTWSSRRGSCSWSARTAPGRRTCSKRFTSARRASLPAHAASAT